jgi:DNA-binding response OmpR family regulator
MVHPRALIVHDNSASAADLAAELGTLGFAVDVVDSGLAAIRQVWERRYARLLIDAGLRGMRAQLLRRYVAELAPESEVHLLGRGGVGAIVSDEAA